ncbi:hypothetical protein DPMN_091523 [Dreissena polymorpha]|uniref:Uncharacterized protein n=1 Tax=Dreissena polymorpha TaxID=45954 RepID=A0A9D4KZN4_DREPO|nr:hypothetical protein DPMN_091523 [Dreissena polymorpha]
MILSQTEVDGIQEEMLTTEQYTIDMDIKFRKLKSLPGTTDSAQSTSTTAGIATRNNIDPSE